MNAGPTIAELMEFAAEPIFFVDGCGTVLDANSRALEVLAGLGIGDVLPDRIEGGSEAFDRIIRRSARTSSALPCGIVLNGGAGSERYKAECRRFGGVEAGAPVFGFRLRVRDANRFAALKDRIDDLNDEVRERRRLQLRLEQSLEANERLLKELQHRVKNNIQMLTALLGQQAMRANDPRFLDLVETARQRLLAIGRAHEFMYRTGQFAFVPAADFIGSLVDLLRESFEGDVRIRVDLHHGWQVPHERANTLALIVNELVVNAYQHGRVDGRCAIAVRLERTPDTHLLTVRDDGPGFPEGVENSDSLGLVLVRGLCNDLGGRLEMVNEGGAVARVRVPVEDAMSAVHRDSTGPGMPWANRPPAMSAGHESGGVAGGNGAALRLLIVEDDFLIAMAIEDIARRAGMKIVGVAANRSEALKLCDERRPDLATMDIRLSDGDSGVVAARELHDRHGVRSLFVSAFSNTNSRKATEETRPLGWISKPFTSGQLISALNRAAHELRRQ
ncbi:MAG: hypothetical protein TEF_03685 [Rhizobiales bacterium NRL2]|nr:MAG: hypothetical protein TEF_03685 [Rhizobiales bacterium NRL2]